MTKPWLWLAVGPLVVLPLLLCGSVVASDRIAEEYRAVGSVLELRRENGMIQKWDLSCGAAALGTLFRYQFGEPGTEKEIAQGLMNRAEYVKHPELLQAREGFSLLDLKRFVDNYRAIALRLESALTALTVPETLQAACEKTALEPRSSVPRIYLVTSLMGGTGSGMFLDLAYLVRRLLREQGQERPELNGLFFVPSEAGEKSSLAFANTYAAFTELNHFSGRDTVFTARYEGNKLLVKETAAPFEHCTLLPLALPETRSGAAAFMRALRNPTDERRWPTTRA